MDMTEMQKRLVGLQAGVEALEVEVLRRESELAQAQQALELQKGALSECKYWLRELQVESNISVLPLKPQ